MLQSQDGEKCDRYNWKYAFLWFWNFLTGSREISIFIISSRGNFNFHLLAIFRRLKLTLVYTLIVIACFKDLLKWSSGLAFLVVTPLYIIVQLSKIRDTQPRIKNIFWRHDDCFSTTRLYLTSRSLSYLKYRLWLLMSSGTLEYRTESQRQIFSGKPLFLASYVCMSTCKLVSVFMFVVVSTSL